MDTDSTRNLPHGALTHEMIGSAMEILNTLGHGLNEKVYENALVHEFTLRAIAVEQQRRFEVIYKGISVGRYIPDLIAGEVIIVDAKCVDRISDHDIGQMINYLRITKLSIGLILNFKHPKLEWQRIAL
jgi:GxxExxY protein